MQEKAYADAGYAAVAGIGAARVATSHYSVIVKDTAQMMIASPDLRNACLTELQIQ